MNMERHDYDIIWHLTIHLIGLENTKGFFLLPGPIDVGSLV